MLLYVYVSVFVNGCSTVYDITSVGVAVVCFQRPIAQYCCAQSLSLQTDSFVDFTE